MHLKIIFYILTFLTIQSLGQQNCPDLFKEGCYFNGVMYSEGEQLPFVCFNLTCTFNKESSLYEWQSNNVIDPSCAGCHAVNDPHFRTFDGNYYDWHGTCSYALSQYLECPGSYDPMFGIFGDFVSCNGGTASCVDITTYKVDTYTVATIKHLNPPSLSVNGYPVSLTTTPQLVCGLPLPSDVHPLLAWKDTFAGESDCVFLQGIDFSVRACYNSLYIDTTFAHIRKLHGLCGYYSGDASDDFMMRDCTILPLPPNIPLFATSWLTSLQSDEECASGKDPAISKEVTCSDEEIFYYTKICEKYITGFPEGPVRSRLIADCVNDCCRNPSECEKVWTGNEHDLALQAIEFGLVDNPPRDGTKGK